MEIKTSIKERFFSIELKSKVNLKNITLEDGSSDNVLIEGTIGKLLHARFAEGVVLDVAGEKGVVRLDLKEDDIQKTSEQKQIEAKA